jgi:class 3 adenylate cyclase/tetratricopeptide (TPR) repeat protein
VPTCAHCGAEVADEARFCSRCGSPLHRPAPTVDERKLVTVLFADLVGSTAFGHGQDPERTRVVMDAFYDAMAAEIESVGGTVEKFAGDAVMAAFGAPDALEDHAERALHAALAMQRRMSALFAAGVELRIGINTGEVVVGSPREGSSFVTGDAVNIAARLEQGAQGGEILVGERTASLVRGAFEFGAARHVEAKGTSGGVTAQPLVRALTLMRPRGVGGLRRAFVGRSEELDLLVATYTRTVRHARPHLVTIMASAGVGKTRLLRELWERLGAESPEPLRRTGRCLAYGRGITYWPLGEVLREHFGLRVSDQPEAVQARLGRPILGLSLGFDAPADLHPLEAREQLQTAWVELLSDLARDQPVVLLIEDVNWADEALLDLLERLARDVRGPLLLIATARPELLEMRPSWGGGLRNASLLWLEPLPAADTGRLLDELLGMPLPDSLREVVVTHAEGNPFFAEELLSTLIDGGILAQHDGRWQVADAPAGFEIPDTVQAVLAARMDLLPPTEKAALQAAAVCGRTFWAAPVIELLDGEEPSFDLLDERDFIRRGIASQIEGETEYVIKHALTREIAYATVPKARRARLHARFAGWIERTEGPRPELAPLLAHHYAEAASPDAVDLAWADDPENAARLRASAAKWLRLAGDAAVGRYEIDEALALYERTLAYTDDPDEQAAVLRHVGRANALAFRGQPFWEAMERSLELTSDPSERGETYAELGFQTSFRGGMWSTAPDREVVTGWISQALELTASESVARAKALSATVFWGVRQEQTSDVLPSLADDAVRLAEQLGDPDLRAIALSAKSTAEFMVGRYDDALEWVRRPLAFIDSLTDPDRVADIYEVAAMTTLMLGHIDEARAFAANAARAAARLSPHHRLHGVAITTETEEVLASWDLIRGLTASIEQRVDENIETFCIRNPRTLLVCSAAHLAAGERTEADRLYEKAGEMVTEGWEMALAAPRVRLALLMRDHEALRDIIDELDAGAGDTLPLVGIPSYLAARLDALVELRDWERIERELEERPTLRGTVVEPFAIRALGRARGDRALVDQAAARFDDLGLRWHAEQTRR